jgi:glycerol-3-phosphate dehydrogenase
VRASAEEIDYLVAAASSYFRKPLTVSDVVWTYSGVRALYDDGASNAQETTRDYVLSLDRPDARAPLLSVFGGKITTYRRLAEDALEKLAGIFPDWRRQAGWTATRPLPGGAFAVGTADGLARAIRDDHPFLSEREARRLVRHYGLEARDILAGATSAEDLGPGFGGFLTEAEVVFLMEREYARTAADVVWRRTKSGLRMNAEEIEALDRWMTARRSAVEPARAAAE